MGLKAEHFPNLVVLIGETISLFFSQLNLVGIFTHHFFMLNIFVEPSGGLLTLQRSEVRGNRHALLFQR